MENANLRGLIVVPYGIIPAREGCKAHTEVHIRQFADLGHELWYLGLGLKRPEAKAMAAVWGDHFFDEPSLRIRQRKPLLTSVWKQSVKVLRSKLGFKPRVDDWYELQWTHRAADLARQYNFDYVVVNYVFFTRLLEAFPAGVRRVIDTHDSFAGRAERLASFNVNFKLRTCSGKDEAMALRRGEYIMANQPDEAEIFRGYKNPGNRVVTVGHHCEWKPLPERAGFYVGFLASGNPMNVAGLTWFVDRCWPLVQKELPSAVLLVAGPICRKSGPWHDAPGIEKLGQVEELADFHRLTTVEINPVQAGTGLKIKTMESLAFGRSLVSVTEGVAGLDRKYGAFLVEDKPESFAAAVVTLLKDSEARRKLVTGAERLISDWNKRQEEALKSLFEGLKRS